MISWSLVLVCDGRVCDLDVERDGVDNDVVVFREYLADDVADDVDVLARVVFG